MSPCDFLEETGIALNEFVNPQQISTSERFKSRLASNVEMHIHNYVVTGPDSVLEALREELLGVQCDQGRGVAFLYETESSDLVIAQIAIKREVAGITSTHAFQAHFKSTGNCKIENIKIVNI